MKKMYMVSALLVGVTLMARCGKDGGPATIVSSDENPGISGALFGKDGSVLKKIPVSIRKKSYCTDTSALKPAKRAIHALSVITDNSGKFSFDSIFEPDVYVVDAKSGNNAVLIDSIKVLQKASRMTLAPDTLRPTGAIKGVVRLSQGGAAGHAFVLAFGIDQFTGVNPDGSFLLTGLAKGVYTLRIVSGSSDYGALDTGACAVAAAETTDVQTLTLPYCGVAVPHNLTAAYDTMRQMVTLRWNGLDSATVNGYDVYRRTVDSNGVFTAPLNYSPLHDTVFIDSNIRQDLTYEYRVSAINKNNKEGVKSNAVKAVISTYFIVDALYKIPYGSMEGQVIDMQDMALNSNGDIVVSGGDYRGSSIIVFDSAMQYKQQIAIAHVSFPTRMSIDNDRVFFFKDASVADSNNSVAYYSIMVFSSRGTLIDTFKIQQILYNYPTALDVKNGLLSLAADQCVYLFSVDGTLKKTLHFDNEFSEIISTLEIIDTNKIFIAMASKIMIYDISGNKLSEFSLPFFNGGVVADMVFDTASQLLYVAMTFYRDLRNNDGVVLVYDTKGSLKANFWLSIGGSGLSLALQKNGELVIAEGAEQYTIIKMRLLSR